MPGDDTHHHRDHEDVEHRGGGLVRADARVVEGEPVDRGGDDQPGGEDDAPVDEGGEAAGVDGVVEQLGGVGQQRRHAEADAHQRQADRRGGAEEAASHLAEEIAGVGGGDGADGELREDEHPHDRGEGGDGHGRHRRQRGPRGDGSRGAVPLHSVMDERQSKASGRPKEFTDLVSELGDLVETLGLEEDAPPPPRRARSAPRRTPRRPAASSAAVATPVVESVLEVETAPEPEPQPQAELAPADPLDDTTFWVPPAEMLEPGGRPWSPAAAMELLPGTRDGAAPTAVVHAHSGWLMTVAASTAVGLAAFALVVSHL